MGALADQVAIGAGEVGPRYAFDRSDSHATQTPRTIKSARATARTPETRGPNAILTARPSAARTPAPMRLRGDQLTQAKPVAGDSPPSQSLIAQ